MTRRAQPTQHRVCGGIFTPDPDVPPRYDADGRVINLGACQCGLVGEPGDTHHTPPAAPDDARSRAAGEKGGEG